MRIHASIWLCFALLACPVSGSPLSIAIDKDGVSLNGRRLMNPPSSVVMQAIMGAPSRIQRRSASEVERMQQEEGYSPNTIYTYDQYGVCLYQRPGSTEIQSITIPLKAGEFSFSPKAAFSGILTISGVIVSTTTLLPQLKRIPNLAVNDSVVFTHTARCGETRILFDFTEDKTSLNHVSITLEPTPADGWTLKLKTQLTSQLAHDPNLKSLAEALNTSAESIAQKIVDKVSIRLTVDELYSRPEVMLSEISRVIDELTGQPLPESAPSLLVGATIGGKQAGFSYRAPAGWEVMSMADTEFPLAMGRIDDGGVMPNIAVIQEHFQGSLADYTKISIAEFKQQSPYIRTSPPSTFRTASGLTGYMTSFASTEPSAPTIKIRQCVYFFDTGSGKMTLAICTCATSAAEKYAPIFDDAMKTFKRE